MAIAFACCDHHRNKRCDVHMSSAQRSRCVFFSLLFFSNFRFVLSCPELCLSRAFYLACARYDNSAKLLAGPLDTTFYIYVVLSTAAGKSRLARLYLPQSLNYHTWKFNFPFARFYFLKTENRTPLKLKTKRAEKKMANKKTCASTKQQRS